MCLYSCQLGTFSFKSKVIFRSKNLVYLDIREVVLTKVDSEVPSFETWIGREIKEWADWQTWQTRH